MTELTFTHETYGFSDERYPKQNLWLLRGPHGVVQFKAGRHRKTPGACDSCRQFADISSFDNDGNCWQAWDLGYHSPVPRYAGHEPITTGPKVCEVLAMESDCYYDGTSLGATELLDAFLASGQDEAFLRRTLEDRYRGWLVDDGDTFASPVTLLTAALREASES